MSPNKVAYGKCPWLCDLLALRIIQYFSFTDGETTKAILGYIIWTEESCVVLSAACRRPECYQMLPGTWVGSEVTRDVKQPPSSSAQQPHWWQLLRKISLLIYFFPLFPLLLLLWVLVPTFPPLDETNISSDTSTHYTNSSSQTVCKYKLHDNATRRIKQQVEMAFYEEAPL